MRTGPALRDGSRPRTAREQRPLAGTSYAPAHAHIPTTTENDATPRELARYADDHSRRYLAVSETATAAATVATQLAASAPYTISPSARPTNSECIANADQLESNAATNKQMTISIRTRSPANPIRYFGQPRASPGRSRPQVVRRQRPLCRTQ